MYCIVIEYLFSVPQKPTEALLVRLAQETGFKEWEGRRKIGG